MTDYSEIHHRHLINMSLESSGSIQSDAYQNVFALVAKLRVCVHSQILLTVNAGVTNTENECSREDFDRLETNDQLSFQFVSVSESLGN